MNLPHPWTAESALALISTDPGAKGLYLASYQGTGDPMTALADVAATEAQVGSPSADAAELRRLQDLTYGRPTSAIPGEEREEAVDRLAALAAAEHERSAAVYAALDRMKEALERGPLASPAPEPLVPAIGAMHAAGAPAARGAAGSTAATGIMRLPAPSRLLLIITLAAGIIVGIGLGLASALGFERPISAPTASAAVSAPADLLTLSRFPGNLTAADVWLARPQTEADVFTGFIVFQRERIESSASRFAGITASGWRLWVAKTPSKGFCLIGRREEGADTRPSTHRACVSRAEFEESSVRLLLDTTTVVWNGMAIFTTIRW